MASEELKIYFPQEEQTKTNGGDSNCSDLFYFCCRWWVFYIPSLSLALNCWRRASAAELPVSLRCEGLLHPLPSEEVVAVPELKAVVGFGVFFFFA